MGVVDIVEAEPPLDAEPVVVGRPVAALGIDDALARDVIRHLTAHAAIGAERIDAAIGGNGFDLRGVEIGGGHERAGRAGLDALAAADAGGGAHRVVEIEHRAGLGAAIAHADDVIDLHVAAGADAQAALDAGIEIDAHGRVAGVGRGLRAGGEAAGGYAFAGGPGP